MGKKEKKASRKEKSPNKQGGGAAAAKGGGGSKLWAGLVAPNSRVRSNKSAAGTTCIHS